MIDSSKTTTFPEVNFFDYANGHLEMRTNVRQLGSDGKYYLTEVMARVDSRHNPRRDTLTKMFIKEAYFQLVMGKVGPSSRLDSNQYDEVERLKVHYPSVKLENI